MVRTTTKTAALKISTLSAAKTRATKKKRAVKSTVDRAGTSADSANSINEKLVESMSVLVRWARRELHDKTVAESQIDIDRSASAILGTLYFHEPVRMSDLAEHLGLDRSTVSRQIAAVVAQGSVRREGDSSDARATVLSLTPHGHTIRRKLAGTFNKICLDLLSDWNRDDRQEFSRLLDKLAAQLSKQGVY